MGYWGNARFAERARWSMIKLLAKFFRGLHLIFGVSAPAPGQNERKFVFTWLAILAFVVGFCVLLTYLVPYLYFRQ